MKFQAQFRFLLLLVSFSLNTIALSQAGGPLNPFETATGSSGSIPRRCSLIHSSCQEALDDYSDRCSGRNGPAEPVTCRTVCNAVDNCCGGIPMGVNCSQFTSPSLPTSSGSF